MFLISYYLERGYDLKKLCNLSNAEKLFMSASAMYWLGRENEKLKAMSSLMQVLTGV